MHELCTKEGRKKAPEPSKFGGFLYRRGWDSNPRNEFQTPHFYSILCKIGTNLVHTFYKGIENIDFATLSCSLSLSIAWRYTRFVISEVECPTDAIILASLIPIEWAYDT